MHASLVQTEKVFHATLTMTCSVHDSTIFCFNSGMVETKTTFSAVVVTGYRSETKEELKIWDIIDFPEDDLRLPMFILVITMIGVYVHVTKSCD